MTMPFYKKRPQWWITLLKIFHITEKQYWIAITIAIIVALAVLALMSCSYSSCTSPSQDQLFIFQILCSCIPTAPLGYYWSQDKMKNFPEGWVKDVFLRGERGTLFETLASLFSPIIIIYVLIKNYGEK